MDSHRPSAELDPVYALPSFLSADAWHHIVAELHLSPQQARIVALILQGKQDKEIAAELRLNRYTIKTYLRRVFDRASLEDRMGLVLRIFELCSNHWPAADTSVPLLGDARRGSLFCKFAGSDNSVG
jgi:DNA-binding CsgD family transcriptional regulator